MKSNCICAMVVVAFIGTPAWADWNSTIAASNPLDWYKFNETTGSTLIDYGSQHLDGTYGTGTQGAILGVPGILGPAAQWNSQTNLILNGSAISGNWSAEFVLMRTGSDTASLIRGQPFTFPSTALKLEQYPDTEQFGYTQFGVVDRLFSPGVPTPLNQWMDVVYVNKPGTGMSLYLDGALVGTNSSALDLYRYEIGSGSDSGSPIGTMSAVVIYNRLLSPAEIESHAAAVPEPSTLALAALGGLALIYIGRRRAV